MSELKPCPFCGGEAVMITSEDGFTSLGCLNGHTFFGVMIQRDTEAEAIEAWNTRYEPTCEVVTRSNGPGIYEHELSCGHGCEWVWPLPPAYCPGCGARVKEAE